MSPPSSRIIISASSNLGVGRGELEGVCGSEDLNSEEWENLVEHVFLSHGILDTTEEKIDSEEQ